MPSPFPGMNPYLENPSVWGDFHRAYLLAFREAIVPSIVPRYIAKIEEHVDVSDADGNESLYVADVSVADPGTNGHRGGGSSSGGGIGLLSAPVAVRMPLSIGKRKVPYLSIVDRDDRQVVTVIELLSPSNKRPGHDREVFLEKRKQMTYSDANYVELDFLRGGPRLPIDDFPECDYYALICRHTARPKADLWPVRFRDALPKIPVPLRLGDVEPLVDLQAMLHRVYDAAGYAYYIYRDPPVPPLSPSEAEWAFDLVAKSAAVAP